MAGDMQKYSKHALDAQDVGAAVADMNQALTQDGTQADMDMLKEAKAQLEEALRGIQNAISQCQA
jgi:hypothetical protein